MPATLKATGFHDAVDFKIVEVSNIATAADAQKNLTGGPGRLFHLYLDGTDAGADYWVKIFDGANPSPGTSVPQLILKGKSLTREWYQIPHGFAFTQLNLWATASPNQTNTTDLTGTATIRLVCS
jgi:hypothetical protein